MGQNTAHGPWNDTGARLRVLLESPAEAEPGRLASAIARHGYEVRVCEGPGESDCELLATGVCAMVDGADVVVNIFDEAPGTEGILEALSDIRRPPGIVAGTPSSATDAVLVSIGERVRERHRPLPCWGDGFC